MNHLALDAELGVVEHVVEDVETRREPGQEPQPGVVEGEERQETAKERRGLRKIISVYVFLARLLRWLRLGRRQN